MRRTRSALVGAALAAVLGGAFLLGAGVEADLRLTVVNGISTSRFPLADLAQTRARLGDRPPDDDRAGR